MGKFYSTKTYGNDRGLSCCFRQWRSTHSHCSLLHGYSIGIKLVFECDNLDERNWVMDFGGLKEFKQWAEYMFDHTLLVAEDDPHLPFFEQMNNLVTINRENDPNSPVPNQRGAVCDLRVVEGVGCERFAEMAFNKMTQILDESEKEGTLLNKTVCVKSVEVFEHDANSAIYEG
jgi:6-pyruvoyltetrahydropterin/6-carboxytetrahydropterin synthase